jgi:hypothetical protein
MKAREFDITIGPDGTVEVHVQGFAGKGCLEAAKVLQEIVGDMQSQRTTNEFYEPDETVTRHIERQH